MRGGAWRWENRRALWASELWRCGPAELATLLLRRRGQTGQHLALKIACANQGTLGAHAIRTAADLGEQQHNFSEEEMGVLCAVAYHQPIDRAGLADIFGKEINRDLLGRLRYKGLIGNGPKSPRPGAPHTFVTTAEFLATFDLQSLRDLPDHEEGIL